MILDGLLQFTAATTGDLPTTGTQNSTNTIDLGLTNPQAGGTTRDIGIGDDPAMKLLVQVLTTFASGTSLQLALAGSIDNVTFTNWWLSPAYAEATLVAGTRLYDMDMPRPPGGVAIPRYLAWPTSPSAPTPLARFKASSSSTAPISPTHPPRTRPTVDTRLASTSRTEARQCAYHASNSSP